MSFDHRISAAAVVAAASLAFSPPGWSLGLGEATVESYLNQPLQVRIDLISQPSDDLTTVTARLASAEDYKLIGASLDAVPVPIGFTLENIEGDAYLRASSNLPISDPVLRLIVEVNWASGRMLREYTLFLDPPTVADIAPPPPRIDQRRTAPAAPAAQPTAAAPPPAVTEAPSEAPARPSSPGLASQEYGPVRSGETLWDIASDWSRGSGLGINRVMIAIQQENPNAFVNGNINLLKRGAILRMPTMEAVEDISSSSATRQVIEQQERFAARRAETTAASAATPLLVEDSPPPAAVEERETPAREAPPVADREEPAAPAESDEAPTAAEPVTEEVAEEAVAPPAETRDQLELVPPSAEPLEAGADALESGPGGATGTGVEQLRESLARTEEELITQRQQNEYLEERIRELESQLEQADKEGVADADLANMQDRLRDQRQAAPADSAGPWYRSTWVWLLGLLVLVVAVAGWLFNRRGGSRGLETPAPEPQDSLEDIRSEAEDVLRTLSAEPAPDTPAKAEPQELSEEPEATVVRFPGGDEDAELLDEESSDPEIQLDLARAYISMGDKEAARVILEEVISNGTQVQQAEARKMLDLLRSP